MKSLAITIIFSLLSAKAISQPISDDSLKILEEQLASYKPDTNRVSLLRQIGIKYSLSKPEVARRYFQEGLALARTLNFRKGEADCIRWTGNIFKRQGQYPEALDNFFKALKISEDIEDYKGISASLGHIGNVYAEQRDYVKARTYYIRAKKIDEATHNNFELVLMLANLGKSYQAQNNLDSALVFYNQAHEVSKDSKYNFFTGQLFTNLGEIQTMMGNNAQAMTYFRNSIPFAIANNAPSHLSESYLGIANLLQKMRQLDSCIFYAQKALASAQEVNYVKGILASSKLLSEAYESIDKNQAFEYYKIATVAKDSLFNAEKVKQVQNLGFVEQQRLQSIEDAQRDYQNKIRLYILLLSSGALLLLAVMLFRNNRNKQKANTILAQQKEEIQRTLNELKKTQIQLIQSEKMASLGELTAGIAHEIQNPLNFVNNFSEVNMELLTEMKSELDKGNSAEAKVIANDIIENQQKINHHGTRAGSIVRGMLQHSRSSSGQKELTDINVLAEEYSRLAYHGFRAKDKTFNVSLETNFDSAITSINIIPQDIGRVILNLITNAFYAVAEKGKLNVDDLPAGQAGPAADLPAEALAKAGYEPTVTLSTRAMQDRVEIRVKDNGSGIPKKVLDKIFQPFFTTKPTGQGTGLGLSLSYDIIKAHGGELKVETKEGEGAEFIIQLPLKETI